MYAPRGVGKTLVALGISYAVATGGLFLRWQAPVPRRVLYLDGEMPLVAMQERLARIVKDNDIEPAPDFFRLVNPDLQDRGFNLATEEGRKRLEPLLTDVSLVVVDNISTLASCGRENEAESWLPLQEWALDLRRRGLSVLFIHHAGKGGAQRGTSRREDVLDTVIALKRPADYDPRTGAQFDVHFEKCRGLVGDDAAPFSVTLTPEGWTMQNLEDTRDEKICALSAEGLNQRDIAKELEIGLATYMRKRWEQLVNDGGLFLDKWGRQAAALGWRAVDLFGVSPDAPEVAYCDMGLVPLLQCRPVIAITGTTARIDCGAGITQTFSRKTMGNGAVAVWNLLIDQDEKND